MALAAASMSLNIFGFTAAVWAMTERVSTSIFSIALQHGQVTSKLGGYFAIERIIPQNRDLLRGVESDPQLRYGGRPLVARTNVPRATLWKNLALAFQCLSCMGKMWRAPSISQPNSKIDTTTTITAIISPKDMRRRVGSRCLAARLMMLRVAKPNTTAQRML